ncbi:MAG: hypothetical protein ACKV19_07005 [Verrucomicrobiales bacterium]
MNTSSKTFSATAETYRTEVRVRGKAILVPAIIIGERTIVANGKYVKIARIKDEAFVQGEIVANLDETLAAISAYQCKADIFCFSQKIGEDAPKYTHYFEWEDFAVINITSYEDWYKTKIKKDARENIRRAAREGIRVESVPYNEKLVQQIKELYDETPIRQGKRFWHHGKSLEEIDILHGTYKDRAEFIAAYLGSEFVGFLKMVYVDNFAKTMHVISKERHFQKRPTNALIAKAVEICAEKGLSHLIYGEFTFGGKRSSSLSEFKQRNGFERVAYPTYYVPLTVKGRLVLKLGLHKGLRAKLPPALIERALKLRSMLYKRGLGPKGNS